MSRKATIYQEQQVLGLAQAKCNGYVHKHGIREKYWLDYQRYCSEKGICYIEVDEHYKGHANMRINVPVNHGLTEIGKRAVCACFERHGINEVTFVSKKPYYTSNGDIAMHGWAFTTSTLPIEVACSVAAEFTTLLKTKLQEASSTYN